MTINYLPDRYRQQKEKNCEGNEVDFLNSKTETNVGEWVKQERKYAIKEFGA